VTLLNENESMVLEKKKYEILSKYKSEVLMEEGVEAKEMLHIH